MSNESLCDLFLNTTKYHNAKTAIYGFKNKVIFTPTQKSVWIIKFHWDLLNVILCQLYVWIAKA